MSRTIFNELGENRVINPRSGFSQFVDLSSNQIIYGNKTFMNDLITNSDVNFNTTANLGRIVFNPNEPAGSGSQIVSIYTTDEIDGNSWIFDSAGNLYYLGGGLQPVKILFSPTGDINLIGTLETNQINCNSTCNTFGDVNFFNVGSKRFIFKPTQSSPSTNPILSIFTVSDVDGKGWFFNANGDLYYNGVAPNPKILLEPSGNITALTSFTSKLLKSSTSGTLGTNKIQLDNRFFDISNGSVDIQATYIGFPYITDTLSLTSKYMAIKPLSTGNFQMEINNIVKKIMLSDWATTSIKSGFAWKWLDISGLSIVEIDGNSGVPFEVYTDNLHTGPAMRFNTGGTLGLYVAYSSVYRWTIDINGASVFSAVNSGSGTIQTTGAINGSTITASTSLTTDLITAITGTATKNSIMMDNQFFNATNGSIDLKAHYVGFPYITQTLSLTSKYMAIVPESDGNFSMQINNIVGKLIYSDWVNKEINTDWIWKWRDSSGILKASIYPTGEINGRSITIAGGGIISTSGTILGGPITCTSLNSGSGTIQTTGTISGTTISGTTISGTTISGTTTNATTFQAIDTNTYRNKIQMSNLFINTGIQSIDFISQYVAFAHPSVSLSTASKYFFINPLTGSAGDVGFAINNISGYFLYTDTVNRRVSSEYTFGFRTAPFSSGYRYQTFLNNLTEIGSVTMLTASSIAFNNTSDYRLKQDIEPLTDSLDRLMLLKPKSYRFIYDVEVGQDFTFDGFLAHEVQNIIPMAVSGVKDDPNMMQQLDYSKFTPLLTGAVQELNEKVEKQQILIDSLIKRLQILENK